MNIKDLTCTLGQAQKLNELGVTAESQYCWTSFATETGQSFALCRPASYIEESARELAWFILGDVDDEIQNQLDEEELSADGPAYPAYTLGELMRMLPVNALVHKSANGLHKASTIEAGIHGCETLEQAAASLLIRLLEINSLTPEQCNAALQEKGGQQ